MAGRKHVKGRCLDNLSILDCIVVNLLPVVIIGDKWCGDDWVSIFTVFSIHFVVFPMSINDMNPVNPC